MTDGLSESERDRRIGEYGAAFLDMFSSTCDKVISMGSRPSPESGGHELQYWYPLDSEQ